MREYDDIKFKELMLCLAVRSQGDPHFGRAKLAKLLFYSDFAAYGELGAPITGARYRKRPLGPVADQEAEALRDLENAGHARVEIDARWLVPLRDPDLAVFTDAQHRVIQAVIDRHHTDDGDLRDLPEAFAGWRLAADNEEIPYFTALIPPQGRSAQDAARLARRAPSRRCP